MFYIVTAFRYGRMTGSQYTVHVGDDKALALAIACNHYSFRGGKYGIEISEYRKIMPDDKKNIQNTYERGQLYIPIAWIDNSEHPIYVDEDGTERQWTYKHRLLFTYADYCKITQDHTTSILTDTDILLYLNERDN